MAETHLISFSIGPVQSFIATARTVRDLWSGSYLLSWLTAHAAKCVEEEANGTAEFLEPDFGNNPIFRFIQNGRTQQDGFEQSLTPTIPNRFIAKIEIADAKALIEGIKKAVKDEWREIATAVHDFLSKQWNQQYQGWDKEWNDQIENCWDIRISLLSDAEATIENAEKYGFTTNVSNGNPEEKLFKAHMFLLGRLDAAQKQIRHYPPHESDDCHRPKCALCGERSQEIPQNISSDEWKRACGLTNARGDRLRENDRFCAVELVKRFAWAHYFSKEKFECDVHKRRVWDTYTIAASYWLSKLLPHSNKTALWLDQRAQQTHRGNTTWNGQWLFWKTPDEDKEEKEASHCPDDVWQEILILRSYATSNNYSTTPPSYYAILMLDGDRMGEKLQALSHNDRKEVSGKLADFAMTIVPSFIEKHHGQLIYAGGDDVLAMLPRETAIACAKEISDHFGQTLPGFTVSGGIAVVHVKHDLRDALEAARKAEDAAKETGRNRLAISIVKRSGEAETGILQWDQIEHLERLHKEFDNGASNRWLYELAATWETLEQDSQLLDAEFLRLLHHSDKAPKEAARNFWNNFFNGSIAQRYNALTLMQHASFLSRAKED